MPPPSASLQSERMGWRSPGEGCSRCQSAPGLVVLRAYIGFGDPFTCEAWALGFGASGFQDCGFGLCVQFPRLLLQLGPTPKPQTLRTSKVYGAGCSVQGWA